MQKSINRETPVSKKIATLTRNTKYIKLKDTTIPAYTTFLATQFRAQRYFVE